MESKYINADEIKNDIKTLWDWETVDGIKSSTVLKQVLSDIDNINEEVVHCEDCKYFGYDYDYKHPCCTRVFYHPRVSDNDYCSYAERRESK